MKKTRISILITLFIVGALPLGIIGSVFANTPFVIPDYEPVDWDSGLAGDMAMPDLSSGIMPEYSDIDALGPGDEGYVAYDWYVGGDITLRAVSDYCEVWVANDLLFPAEDPRNDDPYNLMITDAMAEYLAEEFDRFYDIEANYFGAPFDRDGTNTIFEQMGWPDWTYNWTETDTPQRVILKVLNIVDDNYFNPNYPSYVAGFYSSTYTWYYYNRNMVHIDAWRWWQRLGSEGHQWFPDEAPELEVTRPNLYESTTAHEFQHNIHSDRLPGDDTYMNEACSLYSEPLCEYELDTGQIEWFLSTPDNSLTEWGDQGGINILADYGAAFLWALYLTDHYGNTFMGDYVKNGNSGIDGINALLTPFGVDFYEVFQDWTIANLIHSDKPGGGKYNYDSVDLGEIHPIRLQEVPGEYVPLTLGSTFPTITEPWSTEPDGLNLGNLELNPFATDYIRFPDLRGLDIFYFNGDDITDYLEWSIFEAPGHNQDGAWWSGDYLELKNVLLAGEVENVPAEATLDLYTYWYIEDYWDFGFVQVSTDGGNTWTSLGNEWTTDQYDYHAHHKMVDNIPGLSGWSAIYTDPNITLYPDDPSRWEPTLWIPIWMEFDLSDYEGQDVLIGFRFMTDWGTEYDGWFIHDARVNGVPIELAPVPYEADFMVAVVEAKITPSGNVQCKQVRKMWFKCDATEIGVLLAYIKSEAKDAILIVSSVSEYGTVDYEFKAKSISRKLCRGR